MSQGNFQRCLGETLASEGGLSNHPKDPGKLTNWGVTQRTLGEYLCRPATAEEVINLPLTVAEDVYRVLYWDRSHEELLPVGIDLLVFDGAVNSGVSRSLRWLQEALDVSVDGKWGAATLAAATEHAKAPHALGRRLATARLSFLHQLPTWPTFGRGWENRVKGKLRTALEWMPLMPSPASKNK